MTVTLPIVGDSEGVWGTILNDAITDIDARLITATTKNGTQDTDLTALTTRVAALEAAVPFTPQFMSEGTQITVDSVTTTVGTPVCGVAFTAPASGRVKATLTAWMSLTTVPTPPAHAYVSVQVKTGSVLDSGTLTVNGMLLDPRFAVFISGPANNGVLGSTVTVLSGLTPGAAYNAVMTHVLGAAGPTATISGRTILVEAA